MRGIWLVISSGFVLAAAGADGPTTRPAPRHGPTSRSASRLPVVSRLRLTGRRTVTCKSRWHDIELTSTVTGRLFLSGAEAKKLLPRRKDTKRWRVPEGLAAAIGRRLFEAMNLRPADTQKMAHWLGSGRREEKLQAAGQLNAAIVRAEQADGRERLVVSVAGPITLKESHSLASRFGPNWHKAEWTLQVKGELTVAPADGQVLAGSVELAGKVVGSYGGQNGGLLEPYTEKVTLTAGVSAPPSKETLRRVAGLIRQLGDDSYWRREAASAALLKIGEAAMGPLRAALKSDDPEVQMRAEKLLRALDADATEGTIPAPDEQIHELPKPRVIIR